MIFFGKRHLSTRVFFFSPTNEQRATTITTENHQARTTSNHPLPATDTASRSHAARWDDRSGHQRLGECSGTTIAPGSGVTNPFRSSDQSCLAVTTHALEDRPSPCQRENYLHPTE